MPNLYYFLVRQEDEANITVIIPGEPAPLVAHQSHPAFDEIVQRVLADDASVRDLFDVGQAIQSKFRDSLSERVSVADGQVYVDGVELHGAITKHIIEHLNAGVLDWGPLVRFLENLLANPNEHSREQLYEWLDRRGFTITDDGCFVGYKGVRKTDNGYESIHSGPGIVDGEVMNGHLPNNPGSVVEIARDAVHHDPSVGCSTGLHVGSYEYAKSFARGAVLEVHVNPRDVVSVPTDCDWAKVRTCRYKVVNTIDLPYSTPLVGHTVADREDDWKGVIEWDDYEDDYAVTPGFTW